MNISKAALAIVTACTLMSSMANAEDEPPTPITADGGTIHFTGSLVNAPCAVNVNSQDQPVPLGQYRTASFTKVGDTSASIPFKIVLEDCDASVYTNAAVAFSGQRDTANDGLLAVTSNQNKATAGNVGIQILDEASKPVVLDGSTFSTPHKLIDGENTLPFAARYVSTAATTSAGDADADAVFTMQYN